MYKYGSYDDVSKRIWIECIDALDLDLEKGFVIFGCGDIGTQFFSHLSEPMRKGICCFCDNNPKVWNTLKGGFPVNSVEDTVKEYPDAMYVVAIARNTEDIRLQLVRLGIDDINIKFVVLRSDGKYEREYLMERLPLQYVIDNSYPAEPSIPLIRHTKEEDTRDFRIYIEPGLVNSLDSENAFFNENIMDDFVNSYGKYRAIESVKTDGSGNTNARIMIACSHKDYNEIKGSDLDFYQPIQVGKALTDNRLYELCDDTGENISSRNYNYCECTALYWAWKNRYAHEYDYIGLRHYRRTFDITSAQISHLKENHVDIVHLDPIYHHDIRHSFTNHTKNPNDWDVMKRMIEKYSLEYYYTACKYENQHFMFGYNMGILRRDVFDEYCEFLFGVLLEVESYYEKICDRRDRYLGFLAENLFSIFIMHNKDKYSHYTAKLIPYIGK